MIPSWLHLMSILSLLLGAACCAFIARDVARHPQQMWIMNVVWPVTGLFGSLLAVWAYLRAGRLAARATVAAAQARDAPPPHAALPFAVKVGKGASHCGAGCTLGDVLAEWLVASVPAVAFWFGYGTLFAERIFAVWVLDYVLAFLIGVAFQYFTIAPMRGLSPVRGLVAAVKADALSLTAWQVGMYGFMALAHFWIFGRLLGADLATASVEFWFMMQVAMICGFATAYPVNWWLIRAGIKEAM